MRIRRPLAFAALALLAGCDAAEPNFTTPAPLAPALDTVPLALGNQWVLEGQRIGIERPNGSTPVPNRELGLDTLRIVGDTLIAGERWFEAEFTGASCHGGLFANRLGSLYAWDAENGAVLRAPTGPFDPSSETIRF